MRIAIAGGTGLIGAAVAATLRRRGEEVLVLTRGVPRRPGQLRWDPDRGAIQRDMLGSLDALVNFAGTPIARPWTPGHREAVRVSRLRSTDFAARIVAEQPGCALINGSAVGIYGPGRDGVELTELSAPGEGFLPSLVQDWEAAAQPALDAGNRVAFARTGVVLDAESLTTKPLILLARLGLVSPMGPGDQIWPWITLADHVRAVIHLIDHGIAGPVNLAAPRPATQRELSKALTRQLRGSWAAVPVPGAVFRLVFGDFADEIIGSKHVVPAVLQESGFRFEHDDIAAAARWLLRGSDPADPPYPPA